MTTSHFERLLEKQESRVIAAKDKLQDETREYERIRAQYAKETRENENRTSNKRGLACSAQTARPGISEPSIHADRGEHLRKPLYALGAKDGQTSMA